MGQFAWKLFISHPKSGKNNANTFFYEIVIIKPYSVLSSSWTFAEMTSMKIKSEMKNSSTHKIKLLINSISFHINSSHLTDKDLSFPLASIWVRLRPTRSSFFFSARSFSTQEQLNGHFMVRIFPHELTCEAATFVGLCECWDSEPSHNVPFKCYHKLIKQIINLIETREWIRRERKTRVGENYKNIMES